MAKFKVGDILTRNVATSYDDNSVQVTDDHFGDTNTVTGITYYGYLYIMLGDPNKRVGFQSYELMDNNYHLQEKTGPGGIQPVNLGLVLLFLFILAFAGDSK